MNIENVTKWSAIQRQLGYIEGLAMAVGGSAGAAMTDGLEALAQMIDDFSPIPKVGAYKEET